MKALPYRLGVNVRKQAGLAQREAVGLDEYVEEIKSGLPEFRFNSINILGEGWDHIALECDGVIFRLPKGHKRNDKRQAHVQYEVAALKLLQGKLPVAAPHPIYVSRNLDFFGYIHIPGSLAVDIVRTMKSDEKEKYREYWTELVIGIHQAISYKRALSIGVPEFNINKYTLSAKKLVDRKDIPEVIQKFARQRVKAITDMGTNKSNWVFIHGDFHGRNILLDTNTRQPTGIIDWSDMKIAPVEVELSVLEGPMKEDFPDYMEKAAKVYEARTGKPVDPKLAKALRHVFELHIYNHRLERQLTEEVNESEVKLFEWARQYT